MLRVLKNTVLAAVLLLTCVTLAQARGTANVNNTVHNLSSAGPAPMYQTDSDEVCVFCHTPHGGRLAAPLWNRNDPTPTWQFYNSATLTADVKAVASVSAESLLCLSCHDGSIATNRVLNPPNGLTGINAPQPTTSFGDSPIIGYIPGSFKRIGGLSVDVGGGVYGSDSSTGDLRDDHPISFDYQTVLNNNPAEELHTVANAQAAGIRFFPAGGAGGEYRVECSSCHDPHVDYNSQPEYTPFLNTPNTGSDMCLACHNK